MGRILSRNSIKTEISPRGRKFPSTIFQAAGPFSNRRRPLCPLSIGFSRISFRIEKPSKQKRSIVALQRRVHLFQLLISKICDIRSETGIKIRLGSFQDFRKGRLKDSGFPKEVYGIKLFEKWGSGIDYFCVAGWIARNTLFHSREGD